MYAMEEITSTIWCLSVFYKIQEQQEACRGQSEVTSEAGPQVDEEVESII